MEKNKQGLNRFPTYPLTFNDSGFDELEDSEQKQHEEVLGVLAEKFKRRETPYTLKELREQAQGVAEEWKGDGFDYGYGGQAASFVDESGRLVMVARHQSEVPGADAGDKPQTWRVLFDDTVITVTPSGEFASQDLHWRSGQGSDGIYTTELSRGAQPPEDLQRLIDKFGSSLSVSYELAHPDQGSEPEYSLESDAGNFCSLSEIAAKIKQDYNADWDKALKVESQAQAAKSAVRKGLFMSARKHMQLQEAAYRDSIQRSMSR